MQVLTPLAWATPAVGVRGQVVCRDPLTVVASSGVGSHL